MNLLKKNKQYKGFTLSEVIITLVILGVIAALTIPTINQETRGDQYKSAFKKAISILNQALVMHYAMEGVGCQDFETPKDLVNNLFKERMTTILPNNTSVFTDEDLCDGAVFTTTDGTIFCITNWSTDKFSDNQTTVCNSYNTIPCTEDFSQPNIYIDVNGARNPNKLTTAEKLPKDIYMAQIYNQRVLPFGEAAQNVFYGGRRQW